MLFFVVIPLVFASLANGVVAARRTRAPRPLAGRTFTLFFLNMAIAATLGLLMMNALQPGNRWTRRRRSSSSPSTADRRSSTCRRARNARDDAGDRVEMFMPRNLFGAFVGNERSRLATCCR